MEKYTLSVVVGATKTFVGYAIRRATKAKYNHCTIVLDGKMYGFARYNKYLWFTGCFCTESFDVFSDYSEFKIEITEEEHRKICEFVNALKKKVRIYNYIEFFAVSFGIPQRPKYNFVCSTFVSKVLTFVSSVELTKDFSLYKPMDVYEFMLRRELAEKSKVV